MRDAKTFEYRPGLATEWRDERDADVDLQLRPDVKFHEGWGELTARDVSSRPMRDVQKTDAEPGSAPCFAHSCLDRDT